MSVEKRNFGEINGTTVYEFTLSRGNITVKILNYGGIVRSFNVKTSAGEYDIVLGYGTLSEYVSDGGTYFGSIVGRVANRIADAKFTLNGKEYVLYKNDNNNCLHGGKVGFNRKIWEAEILDEYSVKLFCFSPDGEENFPGNLEVCVVYELTERNGLKIKYSAKSDADTPINLTNHSFFNLNGEGSGDISGHVLAINADYVTPVNENLVPTGEFLSVADTPFDFSSPKKIGKDIDADNRQIAICGGYDLNYVKNFDGNGLIAQATGEKSGIKMCVYTTEQGVQFYSGNFINNIRGKTGVYGRRHGFCLETQRFPNAVNRKEFPSTVLKAGETYKSSTEYVIEI